MCSSGNIKAACLHIQEPTQASHLLMYVLMILTDNYSEGLGM